MACNLTSKTSVPPMRQFKAGVIYSIRRNILGVVYYVMYKSK